MSPTGLIEQQHQRVDVLGSKISCLHSDAALDVLYRCLQSKAGGYVCFTNVHGVVTGLQDEKFQAITNASRMSLADGKPVYWVARSCEGIAHVAGPDFMLSALRRFPRERHYFYGSTPEVLEQLRISMQEMIPDLEIAGMFSPPFRASTFEELKRHYRDIRSSGATLVWVGLGAPKQEKWMADAWIDLRPAVLLGVGAAFEFHAGIVPRAPKLMRRLGLEWMHRLFQQPRRLWRRYLLTNTRFITEVSMCYIKRIWTRRP